MSPHARSSSKGIRRLLIACGVAVAALGVEAARTARVEFISMTPVRVPLEPAGSVLPGLAVQQVTYPARDGVSISAWYVPARNGAAVALFHGYGGNRQELAEEARILYRRGFGLLLPDMRAHGESGGERTTYGGVERDDVLSALRFLREKASLPPERVGLFGFSMGATAVVRAAAMEPRVPAVALAGVMTTLEDFCDHELGAFAWFKTPVAMAVMRAGDVDVNALAPVRTAAELAGRAVLVIHGSEDDVIPSVHSKAVYDAVRGPKQLLMVEGAGHGNYAAHGGPRYDSTLGDFFVRYLLQDP